MKTFVLFVGAIISLALAAPQPIPVLRRADDPTSEKSALTYTATRTVHITSTITGNATVVVPFTLIKPFTLPYGSPVYTGTVTCRSLMKDVHALSLVTEPNIGFDTLETLLMPGDSHI